MTPEELLDQARRGDLAPLDQDRAALADAVRAFARVGDAASALELAARTWRTWLSHGELDAGSSAMAAALTAPGAETVPVWRARTLYADGLFAFRSGDRRRSWERNQEALTFARTTNDARGECDALTGLARIALRDGEYGEVIELAMQARERARAAGDREAEASPLHLQAAGVRLQGQFHAARELYMESLDLDNALGNAARLPTEQHNLGWVELHLGNIDAAERRFRERDTHAGADAYGDAWSDINWSAVASARGQWEEAKRRFALGMHGLESLRIALDPDDQSEVDWLSSRLAAVEC